MNENYKQTLHRTIITLFSAIADETYRSRMMTEGWVYTNTRDKGVYVEIEKHVDGVPKTRTELIDEPHIEQTISDMVTTFLRIEPKREDLNRFQGAANHIVEIVECVQKHWGNHPDYNIRLKFSNIGALRISVFARHPITEALIVKNAEESYTQHTPESVLCSVETVVGLLKWHIKKESEVLSDPRRTVYIGGEWEPVVMAQNRETGKVDPVFPFPRSEGLSLEYSKTAGGLLGLIFKAPPTLHEYIDFNSPTFEIRTSIHTSPEAMVEEANQRLDDFCRVITPLFDQNGYDIAVFERLSVPGKSHIERNYKHISMSLYPHHIDAKASFRQFITNVDLRSLQYRCHFCLPYRFTHYQTLMKAFNEIITAQVIDHVYKTVDTMENKVEPLIQSSYDTLQTKPRLLGYSRGSHFIRLSRRLV